MYSLQSQSCGFSAVYGDLRRDVVVPYRLGQVPVYLGGEDGFVPLGPAGVPPRL